MTRFTHVNTSARPQSKLRRWFDPHSFGGVFIAGVICAVLLAGAYLVSRNTPSATTGITDRLPLAQVSANDGCENFGRYWTDTSGAHIDPTALERFSNCQLQEDDVWVAAGMYGAVPLDESTLTTGQRTQLDQLRTTITAQVDSLETILPGSIQRAFDQLHTYRNNAVVGHFQEGIGWGPYRTRYARIVNAALLDPNNRELAEFIGWIMARKMDGYADFRRECLANPDIAMLRTACTGVEDNLSIRYAPLPWDLHDPALLDTWFSETVLQPAKSEG